MAVRTLLTTADLFGVLVRLAGQTFNKVRLLVAKMCDDYVSPTTEDE